jgi:surfactin family lipopeptide synthetase C
MVAFEKSKKSKNIEYVYALSPMQQGMLFHTLYAPSSGVYIEQMSLTLRGNLNVAAFKNAWQQIIDRHSVLRTLFIWENRQQPLQIVQKKVDLPWKDYDWQGLSLTEQQQHLKELLQAEREQGFQLNKAPLMQCTLIELADSTYKFIWTYHHILVDGWCLSIIFKEVLAFYEAYTQNQMCYLPPARPYQDYIVWLQQQDISGAREFWQKNLKEFSAPTPLVVDLPKYQHSQTNSTYHEQKLNLSNQVSQALQSLAKQHRLTLSILVQAAWALLLSRYSGEQDVVFGVTVSGRPANLSGVEQMVGLFINTLPFRVQVSSDTELIPWLKQLQQQMVDIQQYSYTPLVDIQQVSEVSGGIPLFESIVVFENYPMDKSVLQPNSSLELNQLETFEQDNYPLSLLAASGDKLSITINYDTSRFEEHTIERMLGHLQTMFSAIADNPQQIVGEIPLLTTAERHQLLVEWNDTYSEYPVDKCIHQLFEQQVEETPDAVAVVFEEQQLTYRQLNEQSNQLAHYLHSLGVGPEVLVGLCVERSIQMLVGLLGILKAGAAYVPLDPTYPQERLNYMLEDSSVLVLLTQESLVKLLPQSQTQLVCLDSDWQVIQQNSKNNLNSGVTSTNLAYVIYTSGSTGKPKGVTIEHQSLAAFCHWATQVFTIQELSGVLAATSICFDLSVFELFITLTQGGKVILVHNIIDLLKLEKKQEVTLINTVPSSITEILRISAIPASVKTVNLAGESLNNQLVEQIYLQENIDRIYNLYGPSEDTIYSSFALLDKEITKRPSIGHPIANTSIYILDSHLQPLPIGVPGELHIGGDGLARGYLNRPELTQEKFIPNPFINEPSARLYKTGDLARYLPDGNIEFLGRIDNQVKIRGFRIELGEIESVLNTHPQVQQTVVIATEDMLGNKRLVAYIVTNSKSLTSSQLRELLKQRLPEYMVPSRFVLLNTLPLTPNGKVDRKALPAPSGEISRDLEFVPPRNAMEIKLAQIWSNVLNVAPVGIRDNFFELGGHSLLAIRLMAQIQQHFGTNLPLATLFKGPTIEQMANILSQQTDSLPWSPLVTIRQTGSNQPFFCVPGAGGNVIYLYNLARHLGSEQPFYGLQARGLDGKSKPHIRVEDIASYYIEAIQKVQPQGSYFIGGHSFGSYVAFEIAQQLQKQGHEIALLAVFDTPAPAPSKIPQDVNLDDASKLIEIIHIIERWLGKNLEVSDEVFQKLNPDEQFDYIKEQLMLVDLLPPDAETNLVRGLLQVFDASAQASIHYLPKSIYINRIVLFRASEVDTKDIELQTQTQSDPTWGWSEFSTEPIDIQIVPGDHITMFNEPHVQVLAERLKTCKSCYL